MKTKYILPIVFIIMFAVSSHAIDDISQKDAKELFDRAEAAFAIGSGYLASVDASDFEGLTNEKPEGAPETIGKNGYQFEICRIKELNTKEKFRNYLLTLFSEELADSILGRTISGGISVFEENGGYLYYLGGNVGLLYYKDGKREIVSVAGDGSDALTLRLRYTEQHLEGNDMVDSEPVYYDYKLKKTETGYVFTDFVLPVTLKYNNPQTADAPLIAVCALALSALAAAVVLRKKRG